MYPNCHASLKHALDTDRLDLGLLMTYLHNLKRYAILSEIVRAAPSSSGLGRHPLKVKIAGSNPAGVTSLLDPWCSG